MHLYLSFSLYLSLSLLSLSLLLSLSPSPFISLYLSIYISLYLSLYISLYLSLSISFFISLSFYLTQSITHFLAYQHSLIRKHAPRPPAPAETFNLQPRFALAPPPPPPVEPAPHSTQGILSFLSAPMIGALSDVWGRKPFLFLTVTFTCAPIPLLAISPW